ncbi:alpha/beta fold hydrolase [Nocardia sp. NBC_01327]|uniref:alpha/beta fold hydrolase n=1 Tax=Nocardia sp. NBC_01327 TaxID=2903593 RepID=UPI002E0EDAC1|nr:alpha/beta hydrolase [Nocardia sp. NBC_01327]
MRIHTRLRATFAAAALAAMPAVSAAPAHADAQRPTIVLVHGAFADVTSWDGVAAALRTDGYRVVMPDNPLRGPANDAAAIEHTLESIDGPVVLVGHSYGGAVITNVHDADVKALVYIAAFAPQQGEPIAIAMDPFRFPGSQLQPPALALEPVASGIDGYVTPSSFNSVFAQDVSAATAANMIAHQHSIAATALLEPSGPASWTTTPSWYLVSAADRVIPPAAERFFAQRMGAHTAEVDASHASLVSQPAVVAGFIEQAAQ